MDGGNTRLEGGRGGGGSQNQRKEKEWEGERGTKRLLRVAVGGLQNAAGGFEVIAIHRVCARVCGRGYTVCLSGIVSSSCVIRVIGLQIGEAREIPGSRFFPSLRSHLLKPTR